MSNAAKNFDILATSLSVLYIIIMMVQQNYFSGLYPTKILDLSPFFSCRRYSRRI